MLYLERVPGPTARAFVDANRADPARLGAVLAALGGATVFIWTVASHSRDLFLEITGRGFVAAFYDCVQGILGN